MINQTLNNLRNITTDIHSSEMPETRLKVYNIREVIYNVNNKSFENKTTNL